MDQQIIRIKVMSAEESHKYSKRSHKSSRDLDRDASGDQQEDPTDQKGNCTSADHAGRVTECSLGKTYSFTGTQCGKRGSRTHAVDREICHGTSEGDQQKAASGQSRVHEVLAESAEKAFDKQNCEDGSKTRKVERYGRGERKAQEQAGNNSAAVLDRHWLSGCFVIEKFRSYCGSDTDQQDQKSMDAVAVNAEHGSRKQSQYHIGHHSAGGQAMTDVRTGRHVQ